jgi:circadian clock protein KaiC
MPNRAEKKGSTLIRSGVDGLDHVLNGGLAPNRMYLIEGIPGSGKTTLALQFLMAGVARGGRCLYVTLSESEVELRASAQSHGWDLEGIRIQEIAVSEDSLHPEKRYTMFHASEVELAETTKAVLALAEEMRPTLLVFDSLSELRLLAENPLRYRRQILALKQHFSRQKCTVLFIDDKTGDHNDKHLHSLAHGVIDLDRTAVEYGSIRRRLQITKLRGQKFREGFHDFAIVPGGVQVFPRLVAAEHRTSFETEPIKSGLDSLDRLLGGGIARGTSTLVIGPAGTGKSSLATQYATAAAARGEHGTLFLFDEATATFKERSKGLGMDLQPLIDANRLIMRQIDPAELSPGEFAFAVRQAVEQDKTRLVVIDSLTGYLNALPNERFLILHLHELLTYLGQQGVTTLLLMTQHGMVGDLQVQMDASYLADNVLLLRYFEAHGEVRQAISVIKKRTGKHERTIREFKFDRGITVGEPLREFEGVLSGSPVYTGNSNQLRGKATNSAD